MQPPSPHRESGKHGKVAQEGIRVYEHVLRYRHVMKILAITAVTYDQYDFRSKFSDVDAFLRCQTDKRLDLLIPFNPCHCAQK